MKQHLPIILVLALGALLVSCGGGLKGTIPAETVRGFKTWRILYRYDYKGSELEKQRVTASYRALVESVRDHLKSQLFLRYLDSQEADVTVTIEERQEASGRGRFVGREGMIGRRGATYRRTIVYYMEFFDRTGAKLGSYYERKQTMILSSNRDKLTRKLAKDIATVLNK